MDTIDAALQEMLAAESPRVEQHHGTVVVNPPPTYQHAFVVEAVARMLRDTQGPVVFQNVGVEFAESDRVVPDLVVLTPDARLDPLAAWHPPTTCTLVVEVMSPSTAPNDRSYKRRLYRSAGLGFVLVDPSTGDVTVDGDTDVDETELAQRLRSALDRLG